MSSGIALIKRFKESTKLLINALAKLLINTLESYFIKDKINMTI